jgi:nucleotide-binding universal stress UspA family protein
VRILIGYDGSPGASAALEDLVHAGLPAQVEAIVLSTAETWLAPRQGGVSQATRASDDPRQAAAFDIAEGGSARLRERFPGWHITSEAGAGSPSLALIQRAETARADLIVVGAQSRGTLGNLVLGTIAQKVVGEARASVRVGRARRRTGDPVRVLVALDGSPGSETAVGAVAARQWPKGSQAQLITATGPFTIPPLASERDAVPVAPTIQREQEVILEETQHFQERARTVLASSGLDVSLAIREGDPKHLIVSEAESWGADCVFVGSTGLSRFERLILGSVSAAVVPRAPCSVEVVRTRRS